MRQRKHRRSSSLILLGAIPSLAGALSLTDFQGLTISQGPPPSGCLSAYAMQIPVCQLSDFQSGCAQNCKDALNAVAAQVNKQCSSVPTPNKSLLSFIRGGSIIPALCPSTLTTTVVTTTVSEDSSTANTGSVTIPTASPGVVVSSTSSSTESNSSTESDSSSTDSTSSTSASSTSTTDTTNSTQSTTTTMSSTSTTKEDTTTTSSSTSSTKPSKTSTSNGNGNNGGGGSPFDIDANKSLGSMSQIPIWGTCIVIGIGYLLGR